MYIKRLLLDRALSTFCSKCNGQIEDRSGVIVLIFLLSSLVTILYYVLLEKLTPVYVRSCVEVPS